MNLQKTFYKYELYKFPRQQMLDKTVAAMRELIERAKENFNFVTFARNLVKHIGGHDFLSEVNAIFEFVRDSIRYTRDPTGIELVQSPIRTIQTGFGDCDDKTVLFCALCEAIGHKTRIVLESTSGRGWTHVRADVFIYGQWIPADCTPENKNLGWQSKSVKRRGYPLAGYPSINDLGFLKKIGNALKKTGKAALKFAPVAASFIPGIGTAVGNVVNSIPNKNLEKTCAKPKNAKKTKCLAYIQQQAAVAEQQQKIEQDRQLLQRIAENQNAVNNRSSVDNKLLLLAGGAVMLILLSKN
jgi:transglutaminase-like putative cysteine protease